MAKWTFRAAGERGPRPAPGTPANKFAGVGACWLGREESPHFAFAVAGLFWVEADGGEDGREAGADLVEFRGCNVLDAGDLAAAEVVDGEVETVAGAAVERGEDLVALDDADVLLLVVAMREGDAGDLGNVRRLAVGRGRGLLRARRDRGVRSDAEVDVGPAEGGRRKGILRHGDDGAHRGRSGRRAGVEVEGADLVVGAGEGPVGGIVEREMPGGVVEGAGCGVGGLRVCGLRANRNAEAEGREEERQDERHAGPSTPAAPPLRMTVWLRGQVFRLQSAVFGDAGCGILRCAQNDNSLPIKNTQRNQARMRGLARV